MSDLKNTFCWSFSQAKDFADCKRRHFWNRYGFWSGWDGAAPVEARTAYRLKQMKNKWALIGEAIDRVIAEALKRHVAGAEVSLQKSIEKANQWLRHAWKDHRGGGWRSDPKRVICIREFYYSELPDEPGTKRDAWADQNARKSAWPISSPASCPA